MRAFGMCILFYNLRMERCGQVGAASSYINQVEFHVVTCHETHELFIPFWTSAKD